MKKSEALPANEAFVLIWTLASFIMNGSPACAQNVQHLTITQPGGMPGLPVMTGIGKATNGVNITWDGPAGYYQLFKKASLEDPLWLAVSGRTNLLRRATVAATLSNAFFRVSGPSPHYLGSQACAECHGNIYNTEINTHHVGAFIHAMFKDQGGQTNTSCLACHTVGYGLPTGFAITNKNGIMSYSTNLAGVQCENCHGPAANHAANENDPTARPRVELAANVCGGCHNLPQRPTYGEWSTSGHAAVVPDALETMNSSTNNISSCGRCHSGSVRLALIQGQNPVALTNDLDVAITCVVCHDPHQTNGYVAQLRNPVASTDDYFLTTSTNFASAYNPKINICAQCHNHRGASWTATSRAPHHSPQYNVLIGTVGVLDSGLPPNEPGSHALLITNQCAGCHMQSEPYVSEAQPSSTGHNFTVQAFDNCRACHPAPELLVQFTTLSVSNQIQQLKFDLDFWASVQAPMQLWTNYGVRSWEYTLPGDLSPGGPGPSAAEQALIPVNIQKARFNLYVALYDGSYGVHNGPFTITLLDATENWILEELDK